MKSSTLKSNFSWCVENDFQVYVRPDQYYESGTVSKQYRVCVRRGGITTCGLDYKEINNSVYESVEVVGDVLHKTQKDAEDALPELYEKIRKSYG
jgi:hypothetical protein